jgi:hydroxymethylglutaryl-CoA lyase
MALPSRVRLFEVGPRDGLQNESAQLSVEQRIGYIERLADAGLADIEVGSFVHPRWVPQMAATDDVARRLPRRAGVRYWAIVPNARGLGRAIDAGLERVCVLVSASESHASRNLNKSIAGAQAEALRLIAAAGAAGLATRAYVSVAFGCPFEGPVPPDLVLRLTRELLEAGAGEVSLGDTTGLGAPGPVRELARRALAAHGADRVAFHFHDTRGMGAANAYAVLAEGATILDSAAGGIGGCPYAPGATGNVATEDLVFLLDGFGIETGIDLERLVAATRWLEEEAPIAAPSRYYRAARSRG